MSVPKILVFSGSIRAGSYNTQLAALAAKELTLADVEVTRISLADYPLPIYDPDFDIHTGSPPHALRLRQMIGAHQGVFIAAGEYSASVTPLLKNAIDWVSHVREGGGPAGAVFRNRVFAIGNCAISRSGGPFALLALRQILEVGCGALVIPEQVAIADAATAFDDMGNIVDVHTKNLFHAELDRLVEVARLMM
ncbi:MAG TPA: NAD(P)H-dependent oxidoreductase [Pseudolabrys sp.]|jgi:NAD(P)H-dependent FMN reductase|nr:NAD(P)H-dependent oxidoreductase [Pseudolabrys sp.]